ncbi:cyclin-dependent kinase inhibitor 4-like [Curcuma longa]|uniref:cyclin-dependent kinase inhibitor 4-like n=1 Tax=Curcuma longa TaxID=136217 RepID=UPI003D9F4DA9
MGKYMRKAKGSGEVASMDVTHRSTLGVRTRARALAAAAAEDSCDYLELRSRRLEKPLLPLPARKDPAKPRTGPCMKANSGSVGTRRCSVAEASFGENFLEAEARDSCAFTLAFRLSCCVNTILCAEQKDSRKSNIFHILFLLAFEVIPYSALITRKYNFDPVDDHPLPGRYEWVKIDF